MDLAYELTIAHSSMQQIRGVPTLWNHQRAGCRQRWGRCASQQG